VCVKTLALPETITYNGANIDGSPARGRRDMRTQRLLTIALVFFVLAQTPASQAAGHDKRVKIAVLDLKDKGVGPEVASLLTSVVSTRLAEIGIFDVISREDVRNILTHEQDKMLLGCADESCYVNIGGILGSPFLVAGEVGMVGEKYVIGLQRIDVKATRVAKRVDRQFKGSRERLLREVGNAAYKVVEDILKKRSGTLVLDVSEAGADVSVDGKTLGVSPLAGLRIPAGPRDVRVAKRGFVDWARTIQVEPDDVQALEVTMIPSADFIADYEAKAGSMRIWAWITLGTCLALEATAVALRTYTYLEYDPIEDDYNNSNFRGMTAAEFYARYKDDMDRAQIMDYAALAGGIVGVGVGVLSAYLFIEGDDPDRYQKFRGIGGTAAPSVSVTPSATGGSVTFGFSF